ncbi:b(o/a)3-type cytochrome-c oxidase subunit 1 [Lysinibacillus sphaericus]|uniref:Cytochrome C n=2 Tax=Lysinibacillus TaxID=400634 RepID=A0A2S0K273_LYSSH|nr:MULTISPECIES: b(o/a)3-type cytochrome-c oxidase subunit 1 [Lysinibacillus]AHN21450.1 cytochrome C [Lysinibacillus varians]AVK97428.1 cytochrome C [Lysinibacillus sphaericus]MCS1382360.1 b(o/a)3-type cytochrome-c oxidase subunit 1 [Lysinibacillus sphaericus]MED4542739.1 b(o/a)3-type cytochrome-c oxidase subunit 1 [Lysinibacillus sphaericus]TKI21192.1 b(o/a)3-type cytochrome-c oxidase subunit 1 [Lysinibacillus sphaericus]
MSLNNAMTKVDRRDAKLALAHVYVAFIALLLGGLAGLLQVFVRSGQFKLPAGIGYYQVLTVHGVLLGLILTTFFIFGFQIAGVSRTSGTLTDKQRLLGWIGFWFMTIGTVAAAVMVLLNKATVLYTFYAPLQAHWIFYLGLTLVVVGSWIGSAGQILRYVQWRKEHKGQTSPLLSFMVVVNNLLWFVASLGVAVSVLFQLLPWSLGLIERVDVLLSRTLFWYFGHALVYFWLLPAYMVWYVVIPKVIGGKVFSDSLARLSFMLFLIFSVPVGLHHQLTEPGIDTTWKFIQVVLTMAVVVPSLMTAFSLFATFELRGRELGGKGLFGWFKKLPWKDARFIVPFIGMLAFIPGGAGGIVNASYQMNQLIHNTIWVPGHFHLTFASAVVLTYFGAAFWLIPHLTGRKLTKSLNSLGIVSGVLWAVGMTIMSTAMHIAGLLGAPRRSDYSEYGGAQQAYDWIPYQIAQAVGGTILFIAILVITYVVIKLAWFAPKGEEEFPIASIHESSGPTPPMLENFKVWLVILVALIIFAYTIPIFDIISNSPAGSKGFKLW